MTQLKYKTNMKRLILIIAVLFSVNCIAQGRVYLTDLFTKADSAFTELYDFNGKERILKVDTIRVKALCSYDYLYSKYYSELKIEPVFVTYLLQIRKHYFPYHPDYILYNEQPTISIVGYLYETGIPLSKIVNIWIAKQIIN